MKHIKNTLALVAVVGGFVASVIAPWWAVWFICLPVIFAGVVYLLSAKTDYIQNY